MGNGFVQTRLRFRRRRGSAILSGPRQAELTWTWGGGGPRPHSAYMAAGLLALPADIGRMSGLLAAGSPLGWEEQSSSK